MYLFNRRPFNATFFVLKIRIIWFSWKNLTFLVSEERFPYNCLSAGPGLNIQIIYEKKPIYLLYFINNGSNLSLAQSHVLPSTSELLHMFTQQGIRPDKVKMVHY